MPAPDRLRLITREFDGFALSFGTQADHFRSIEPDFELELEQVEVHTLYERMVAGGGGAGRPFDRSASERLQGRRLN